MDKALDIAVAEGWNGVTIRKIADAVEYTPPIVYEYFKDKEDLLNELSLWGHRMLYNSYDRSIQSETDDKKSLLLISEAHWDFAFQNKELYQLMFRFGKPLLNEEIEKIIERNKDLFFVLTDDEELSEELMFNWLCLLHGIIFFVMQMEFPPELAKKYPKDLYIKAVKRFLKGI